MNILFSTPEDAADILTTFAAAVDRGTTLPWCVAQDDPVVVLDDAWLRCRDEGVMRRFLLKIFKIDSLERSDTRCIDTSGVICNRSQCPGCVRLMHAAFPLVGALAIEALASVNHT